MSPSRNVCRNRFPRQSNRICEAFVNASWCALKGISMHCLNIEHAAHLRNGFFTIFDLLKIVQICVHFGSICVSRHFGQRTWIPGVCRMPCSAIRICSAWAIAWLCFIIERVTPRNPRGIRFSRSHRINPVVSLNLMAPFPPEPALRDVADLLRGKPRQRRFGSSGVVTSRPRRSSSNLGNLAVLR